MHEQKENGARDMEFVILSGPDVHDYLVEVRSQLRRYLAHHFPEYRFSLAFHDCEGMGFLVVPVVASDEEDLASPHGSMLDCIRRVLEAFAPATC